MYTSQVPNWISYPCTQICSDKLQTSKQETPRAVGFWTCQLPKPERQGGRALPVASSVKQSTDHRARASLGGLIPEPRCSCEKRPTWRVRKSSGLLCTQLVGTRFIPIRPEDRWKTEIGFHMGVDQTAPLDRMTIRETTEKDDFHH